MWLIHTDIITFGIRVFITFSSPTSTQNLYNQACKRSVNRHGFVLMSGFLLLQIMGFHSWCRQYLLPSSVQGWISFIYFANLIYCLSSTYTRAVRDGIKEIKKKRILCTFNVCWIDEVKMLQCKQLSRVKLSLHVLQRLKCSSTLPAFKHGTIYAFSEVVQPPGNVYRAKQCEQLLCLFPTSLQAANYFTKMLQTGLSYRTQGHMGQCFLHRRSADESS